jgi:hypothetical protein
MANEFFIGSIKQLAERLKVEYASAAGLVKVLVELGLARETGKEVKEEGKRGKGSTLWALPWSVSIEIPKVVEPVVVAATTVAAAPELPDDLMSDSNLPQSPAVTETITSEETNGELAVQDRVGGSAQANF